MLKSAGGYNNLEMEKLYEMTVPQLYRGILKMVRTYPSKNRGLFREAIIEEIGKYKNETDELENKKVLRLISLLEFKKSQNDLRTSIHVQS